MQELALFKSRFGEFEFHDLIEDHQFSKLNNEERYALRIDVQNFVKPIKEKHFMFSEKDKASIQSFTKTMEPFLYVDKNTFLSELKSKKLQNSDADLFIEFWNEFAFLQIFENVDKIFDSSSRTFMTTFKNNMSQLSQQYSHETGTNSDIPFEQYEIIVPPYIYRTEANEYILHPGERHGYGFHSRYQKMMVWEESGYSNLENGSVEYEPTIGAIIDNIVLMDVRTKLLSLMEPRHL